MKTRNRRKIRVLLADANLMTSRLLSQALEKNPEYAVIGCVLDADNLARELENQRPDVLLATMHVPELSANRFAALKSIIQAYPGVPCVLLLDRSDCDTVVDAFRAGVKGVFSCAEADTKPLEKCIKRVVEGQIWADTTQLHYIVSALPSPRLPEARAKKATSALLTPREDQVMRLVAEGMGNREIAGQMDLSENTVKNYLFRIFEKLGFSNRVELVLYAMANANQKAITVDAMAVSSPDIASGQATP